MPRSSDEMETKTGSRTINPSGSSVHDTQPRRSTRFKLTVSKNNEGSPESPQSDNNTANPRVTRKRAGTMDSGVVSEKVRTLRSRKTSVSPTISEVLDVDTPGTPSRRTRRSIAGIPAAETPKAVPARTRRLTRAGSEVKSPPRTPRTTRRTRASSVGPEAITDMKEEIKKVVKTDKEHTLPEIIEVNEESKRTTEKEIGEDKEMHARESEGTKEEDKGQQSFIKSVASAQNQNAKNDILSTKTSALVDLPKNITVNEKSLSSTGTPNTVIPDEESSQDGSKDFELQIENTSHESTEEQHSDMSNKENETTHTISDMEQNTDNVKTSITLQSTKTLRPVLTNILAKEKPASPLRQSVKNSEYIKETARASVDASVIDVNTTPKMEDVKSSVNETVESLKVSENKESTSNHEVLKSPLLICDQPSEATPTKSSDLSVNIVEEKSGENANDTQNAEDNTEREKTEKDIIDGIEITDITGSEIIETEDPKDVETTGIVDDSETSVLDGAQEEATDEPMDISILEFRETITENSAGENEKQTEDVVEVKSVETSSSDAKSETVENLKTPSKLNPAVLPSLNISNESNALRNTDVTNSENTAPIEIADEKCHDVHASDAIKNDSVVTKDESNPSDAERNESSIIPEPEVECMVERSMTEETSIEPAPQNSASAASKLSNQTEFTKPDEHSEKQNAEKKGDSKNTVTSEIDSDANTECLFQDIPATEWNKKKKQSDNESISSLTTEKLENESEAECDLVLVDREAWLVAESFKAAKENEMSDYDSDDTVVLKSRRDFVADRLNRSTKLQTLLEEDDDTDEIVSNSARKKSLTNRRKSVTASTEKKVNMNVSPQVKENVISSDSPQRSTSRKHLSRSLIMHETKDPSIKNVNLNKSDSLEISSSKKRRSLNKSVHNISLQDAPGNENKQDSEVDSDTIQLSSRKKKRSINKSQINENSDDDYIESLADSKKKRKSRHSLNKSSTNKADLDESSSNKSCDESKESSEGEETNEIPSSVTKSKNEREKHKKNVLSVVHVGSDSDEITTASDSDDANNKTATLPRFLFAGAESDTDNMSDADSIDSDIKREYNLDGKNISKFDDDDVPGDECRASESEYSDSNDNGSDLADFVVNDDEVEDDADEDEEAEADDQSDEEVNVDADENEVEVDDEKANVDVDRNEEDNVLDDEEEIQSKEDTADELEKDHNNGSNEEEELATDESGDDGEGNDIDVQGNEDEMKLESLQSSKIQKNRLEKSIDSALSDIIRSEKKKRESQNSISIEAEAEEDEVVNISKKEKRKKSNKNKKHAEFDTSREQHFDELCTRTTPFNKSLECSTPKHSMLKQERFHTSLDTPNITLQAHKKTNKISTTSLLSSIFSKTATKDIPLKTETPLRKLQKTKKIDKLLHKSLPVELIDLPKETNLSRVTSSNVSQLHKAVATADPTQHESHRNEELNVSNETIKTNKRSKRRKIATHDELSENTIDPEDPKEVDVSEKALPRVTNKNLKILAKAEALQKLQSESNNNQSKKLKKRKRDLKHAEIEMPLATGIDETPILSKEIKRMKNMLNQDSDENVESQSKKKKKMKMSSKVETEVVLHQVSNIFAAPSTEANQKVLDKRNKKKNNEKSKIISPGTESVSSVIMQNKKNKVAKTLSSESAVSAEKPQKKQKPKEVSSKLKVPKKFQVSTSVDSDDEPEAISFSKAREDAVQAARLAAESLRVTKQMKRQRRDKHFEKTSSEQQTKMLKKQSKSETTKSGELEVPKKGIKRLADDVLENLADVPKTQTKKRKISKKELQFLPSKSVSNFDFTEDNIEVAESFIPLSSHGSTTQFSVVNLQKLKRQTKNSAAVASFRQKMLGRNSRQPVSAYMMYIEKQKAKRKRQG